MLCKKGFSHTGFPEYDQGLIPCGPFRQLPAEPDDRGVVSNNGLEHDLTGVQGGQFMAICLR